MIAGIGVDIVEISRLERAIEEYGDRFVNRVFTKQEIDYCERVARKAERYATGNLREVYFYPAQVKAHAERTYNPGG